MSAEPIHSDRRSDLSIRLWALLLMPGPRARRRVRRTRACVIVDVSGESLLPPCCLKRGGERGREREEGRAGDSRNREDEEERG
eukprot:2603240-Pyramimonas_sp.AAC.1